MKRNLVAGSLLTVLCSVGALAEVQASGTNPLIGVWKVNVAKSKYSPGPAPKSDTFRIEGVEGGIRVVHEAINHQGQAYRAEFTAKFDGKDYPWHGTVAGKPNTTQDAVAVQQIDDYTYEVFAKLKGKVFITARWVISRDGKTGTFTVTGKDAEGRIVNNTVVVEKQ